jgi:hypothetical protein
MEQTETERKKHGNRIFEHGTIKKRKKKYFLIYFRLKCGNGTIETRI